MPPPPAPNGYAANATFRKQATPAGRRSHIRAKAVIHCERRIRFVAYGQNTRLADVRMKSWPGLQQSESISHASHAP
jgi:hypothetical protein